MLNFHKFFFGYVNMTLAFVLSGANLDSIRE